MLDIRNPPVALLLAAHGERRLGAANGNVTRLAATLRDCGTVQEVAFGFIKGVPSINQSIRSLLAGNIVVFPLFLSDGYFTRVRLPQLLGEVAADTVCRIEIVPPLGLHPALAGLIVERLVATARSRDLDPARAGVVLLAHGSRKDPASRTAGERLAERVRQYGGFRAVRVALLEEAPSLSDVTCDMSGGVLVFGLFAGDGMHGAEDAPRLIGQLGRSDVHFAGTIASLDGIASLIEGAVARARICQQATATRCDEVLASTHRAHVLSGDMARVL
jgi:sirohydrochlorin ferrochelatase